MEIRLHFATATGHRVLDLHTSFVLVLHRDGQARLIPTIVHILILGDLLSLANDTVQTWKKYVALFPFTFGFGSGAD